MNDILIPLGNGSAWDNNELRYALRSLEKYGFNFDRLFIIGERPSFLKDYVHIPYSESKCSALNVLGKIIKAFEKSDISENVFFTNDDIFLTEFTDCGNYPYLWRRELEPKPRVENSYWQGLTRTREILIGRNLPIKDFSLHCPIIFKKAQFLALKPFWQELIDKGQPVGVRALYGNALKIEGIQQPDLKFRKEISVREFEEKIKGRSFFSIGNGVLTPQFKKKLEEMYPQKSRWEK